MKTKLKTTLKATAIALTLAIISPSYAGGIAVFDGAAISQATANSLKELA